MERWRAMVLAAASLLGVTGRVGRAQLAAIYSTAETAAAGTVSAADAPARTIRVRVTATLKGQLAGQEFHVAVQRAQDMPAGLAVGGPAALIVGRRVSLVHLADRWLIADLGDGRDPPTYTAGAQDASQVRDVRQAFGGTTAALLRTLANLKGAGLAAQAPGTTVTVEATLTAMSKVPTLVDLGMYKESLVAVEWRVDRVAQGTLTAKTIIVYHWSFLDRKFQAAAAWKPGERRTLRLRPWQEVPEVQRLRRDENITAGREDVPAFYDTALGAGLPAVVAAAQTGGKILEAVRKGLGSDLSKVKIVNGADCHGLNDLNLLYGGTGRGKAVSVGGPGTFFPQHELGYRLAAAECPNLEWGIQSGGTDRPCGGFGGAGYPLRFLAGPAWPALPGRGPAPVMSGEIDVTVLPGVGRGDVESLGVLQNCIREYGRRGKGFVFDPEFRSDGYILRGGNNQAVHERFRSWGKVYPNFLYFHIYDPDATRATVKAGLTVSCATIEKARVAAEAKGLRAKLIPWAADPPDAKPDAAALAKAVQVGGGGGNVVVGGAWIANVMAGTPGMAAFADAGIAEAELVLRSAVAAGKKPKCVVWGIEPMMLTAPKTEQAIAALSGPNWPMRFGGSHNQPLAKATPLVNGAYPPIRLGHGTTVARGKGVWEFGLEYSLILEATLRELGRQGQSATKKTAAKPPPGVVLVLGPNTAGIPAVAYEGLADRLRAYTVIYDGVRFVEPAEIAGKPDAQVRAVVEAHLADPKRGVMESAVPARGGW